MSEIVPVTREEKLVDAIIDSEVIADKGVTRAEKYLEHIMKGTTATEEPVTRAEHYLAKIAGMDVQLEEPVTRVEIYLAAIAGMTVDLPAPVTRLEKLLAEWAEASAGELKTVTGAVVAVSDALARKAEDLTVAITPIQSGTGTPSPDNVRPITGHEAVNVTRTGRNILDTNRVELGAYDQTTGEPVAGVYNQQRTTYAIGVNAGDKIVSTNELETASRAYFYNDSTYVSTVALYNGTAITVPSGVNRVKFASASSGFADLTGSPSWYQIEFGSTATAYTPYVGDTYDVQFPAEAGTVYGGQLDVTTGVLTVTHGMHTFTGNENWTVASGGSSAYTQFPLLAHLSTYTNAIVCDRLKTSANNGTIAAGEITGYNDSAGSYPNSNWIYAAISGATTGEEYKAWFTSNPTTIVYKLKDPITYQLTPQEITMLLGDNNVWSDTGDSTLTYWAEVTE